MIEKMTLQQDMYSHPAMNANTHHYTFTAQNSIPYLQPSLILLTTNPHPA